MNGCGRLPIRRPKREFWRACAVRRFGAFGDCQAVGEGVSEMRVHVGPGYRVYFVRTGATVYVLLTGGDKSSQKQDIARAKSMARALKEAKP
jgi:putative addiction module killer protein